MRPHPKRFVPVLIGLLFTLGMASAHAAKAPLSPEKLKKSSSHIVSGKVLEVVSKVQKSKNERGVGIHRDRVFTIKVLVKEVSKGGEVKVGDKIEVVAWRPSTRLPRMPGLQGHESIPKKGDIVQFFLEGGDGKAFEPLLPNGILIEKEADRKPGKAIR
ncbi:MAG: hypothetical protein ACR2RV_25345 [Verrucomicrobiales bacterium]